ncbi:MAG TPA: hypothetical protein VFD36_11525, partial [Kofleriaceae bacterium]|nr:hypothetical protein [Kofleriaceae bacterium]
MPRLDDAEEAIWSTRFLQFPKASFFAKGISPIRLEPVNVIRGCFSRNVRFVRTQENRVMKAIALVLPAALLVPACARDAASEDQAEPSDPGTQVVLQAEGGPRVNV